MKTQEPNNEMLRAANDNPGGETTVVLFNMVTLIAQAYVAKERTKEMG